MNPRPSKHPETHEYPHASLYRNSFKTGGGGSMMPFAPAPLGHAPQLDRARFLDRSPCGPKNSYLC